MSDDGDKFKHSRRLLKDQNAVNKQVKIAKQHGLGFNDRAIKEPHRMSKHHVMDCGNPQCGLCGNPRHIHKDSLTAQEKRLFQDLDSVQLKNKNHLSDEDESS